MARYIDADALDERKFPSHSVVNCYAKGWNDAIKAVQENAPTIDARPVVRGEWEECDWVEYDGHSECVHYPREGCVCTNCRNAFKKEFVLNPRVNHCPHCGAEMRRGYERRCCE